MAKKLILTAVVICYMLLIIVGSISNLIDVPWQNIELQDKIIHFVAYALLCFLLFLMIESYKLRNNLKYSILVSIVFGAAIEFLQFEEC